MPKKVRKPKKTCCLSRSRCGRCPIRMLKEGTLPEGYTVKRRKLVKTSTIGKIDLDLVDLGKAGSGKHDLAKIDGKRASKKALAKIDRKHADKKALAKIAKKRAGTKKERKKAAKKARKRLAAAA